MTPYNEPNLIREVIYISIWFLWAFISIIYWLLWWKKITILNSLWMIIIGWFIGWLIWVWTNNMLLSALGWAMSMEIMHIIKEYWPSIIKQKIKNYFNIK